MDPIIEEKLMGLDLEALITPEQRQPVSVYEVSVYASVSVYEVSVYASGYKKLIPRL